MRLLLTMSSLALAACGFSADNHPGDGDVVGPHPEAGMQIADAMPDAIPLDGCTTFSTKVDTCGIGVYGPMLTINGNKQYNTQTRELSDDPSGNNASTPMSRTVMIGGSPVTVLVVDGVTISGKLRVFGGPAFGIVSTNFVTIGGTIDATSGGAGARMTGCGNSAGVNGQNNPGGAGGASGAGGGGFGAAGGKGGLGDSNGSDLAGGNGGVAAGALPAAILGGCPGGRGGNQGAATNGGAGAPGGGGVFITSAVRITVPLGGVINAGGGGGARGNMTDGGAGGGGSGGMIFLEAPAITIGGAVVANGGGGGGGAGNSSGGAGQVGQQSAVPATGGTATGGGSLGGGGGAGVSAAQNGLDAAGGSGAGGGGVGFITTRGGTPTVTGIVSPLLSQ